VAILLRIWILSVISEDTGDRFIQLQGMVQNLCVSVGVFFLGCGCWDFDPGGERELRERRRGNGEEKQVDKHSSLIWKEMSQAVSKSSEKLRRELMK
jgi:hypothetical protein